MSDTLAPSYRGCTDRTLLACVRVCVHMSVCVSVCTRDYVHQPLKHESLEPAYSLLFIIARLKRRTIAMQP